jgi:hypothetical protein
MDAVAHGWKMPGGGGPSKAVAHEFVAADKAHPAFANGGLVMAGNKGYLGRDIEGAKGGAKLGRTRDFMKVPDQFTDGRLPPKDTGSADDPEQAYEKTGKTGKLAKPTGDKCLPTVKPRC